MIEGLSHITLIVKDLEKSAELMKAVFDAREIYSSGEKKHSISKEKFFLIDDLWIALMEGDSVPGRSYNHIAFKISYKEFDSYLEKIIKLGLEIKVDRKRILGEGHSIYFFDYDNHLFELHTGYLKERLSKYNT